MFIVLVLVFLVRSSVYAALKSLDFQIVNATYKIRVFNVDIVLTKQLSLNFPNYELSQICLERRSRA